MKVQDVASAVLWFRGHSAFEGDALATAWNSAQKAAAVMVKEYPRAVCVEMHDRYVEQSKAKPPVKPHLTSELKKFSIILGKSLAPMPSEGTARGFLGPVPSLQVLCAKAVLPEVKFTDVVQAVLHFAACGLRRRRSSQNVRKPRKDKGKERTRERVLPETAEYVDNLGQVSDSGSSLSSFGSISTDASSASALTVSDEESGTDSDSDSE